MKSKKSVQGFTLIEMIMCIAIMGILMAVLIHSIASMTLKAKVITDIRSIQIIQRQLELYRVEHKDMYPTASGDQMDKPSPEEVIRGLGEKKYIDMRNPDESLISKQIGMQLGTSIVWDDDEVNNLALGKVLEEENNLISNVNKVLQGLANGTHKLWINVSN